MAVASIIYYSMILKFTNNIKAILMQEVQIASTYYPDSKKSHFLLEK